MQMINSVEDTIENGTFLVVELETKKEALFTKEGKAKKFIKNIFIDIDCQVEDLCEMFLDHFFEDGEISLTAVSHDELGQMGLEEDDFVSVTEYPYFRYVWESIQSKTNKQIAM